MLTNNHDLDNNLKHGGNSKASQLKFVRPAHLTMFANVVCDPPLGQTAVIPFQQRSVCSFLPKFTDEVHTVKTRSLTKRCIL